ncbi:MAG: hypothetical protein AAFY59_15310, partial [Pseudomonadota bacterium]
HSARARPRALRLRQRRKPGPRRPLDRYEALAGALPGVAVKGKKMRYTAVNGNMFSFVDPEGQVCVRLSAEDKAAFEAEHGTGPVMQYGAVMNGYVPLPEAVLADDAAAAGYFAASLAFAETLKPK